MKRALSMLGPLVVATACVHSYQEPAPSEPHALVKIRLVYHAKLASKVDEKVTLGEDAIAVREPGATTATPATRAIRVRPAPSRFRVAS